MGNDDKIKSQTGKSRIELRVNKRKKTLRQGKNSKEEI